MGKEINNKEKNTNDQDDQEIKDQHLNEDLEKKTKNGESKSREKDKKKWNKRRRSKFSKFLDDLDISEDEIDEFMDFENWYDHYQAEHIMKHHLYLFKKAQKSNDNRGNADIVIGENNTGKSTLACQWMYDMVNCSRYDIKPREIIYFEVPPGTRSDKVLFAQILDTEFGQELTKAELKKISTVSILDRLKDCFKRDKTKIVILDEIQLLLKNPLNQRIFDNLKYLLNFNKWGDTEVKTNWILYGTQETLELLKIDKWIDERANVLELKRYDTENKKDKKQILEFLSMVWLDWTESGWFDAEKWDLFVPQNNVLKPDGETISKLHQISDGKIGKLYQIMKKAGYWALTAGRKHITLDDYTQGVLTHEKEVEAQRKKEEKAAEVEADENLIDNSMKKIQIEESLMVGICIICENEHRDGKAYTHDRFLRNHYKKKHAEEVSEWGIEELLS